MKKSEPVDPLVRLAISQWPQKAPRGAVTTFCAEHGISRETFYVILRRARSVDGPAAALEPLSRRPKTSPTVISDEVKARAVEVRAALEASGLDHGPISVFEKMRSMGLEPPSVASLARIFREAGVARKEPKKKPRAAFRRFVYPAPNACWQLDATEYVLAGGRKATILQLIDDHSRLAVASHVARSETAAAALAVVEKGIAARGVPQRLLSDNHVSLNPTRRGYSGQLVDFLTSLGVTPITGKPNKPTTQGKNERFHQTLLRWLDKQPLAGTIAELQAQVDAFDIIYNTQRPHQALPGRITPQEAWDATPVAPPPRPRPTPPTPTPPPPQPPPPGRAPASPPAVTRALVGPDNDGVRVTKVRNDGTIRVSKVEYRIGARYAGQQAYVIATPETIEFFDHQGASIVRCPRPLPGVRYVGAKQLGLTQVSGKS